VKLTEAPKYDRRVCSGSELEIVGRLHTPKERWT
jgi:hypothetical protein